MTSLRTAEPPGPDRNSIKSPGQTASVSSHDHLIRAGLVMMAAALLLGWLAKHTDVFFADGLRYIAQAKALDRGALSDGLRSAVDHPVYPLAIAATHRALGGDTPEAWQASAQAASIAFAVLLVMPIYLVGWELFGARHAGLGALLFFVAPVNAHVFADTLSESTFLFFWTWGLWAALRFLRAGGLGWLPLSLGASGLAYLTRPEGLLLPAALVATLTVSPRWVARGLGRRGVLVSAVVLIGSLSLIGPYVVVKGGLTAKPSVARWLGTAPRSATHAVERQRPLEPDQTALKTYALAGKAVAHALNEAVAPPLLALAVVGLVGAGSGGAGRRAWTLLAVIGLASFLGLMRLHATGGYCSARHAQIFATVLIPSAAYGLTRLTDALSARLSTTRWTSGFPRGRVSTLTRVAAVAGLAAAFAPELLAPVNAGLRGYQDAGHWLAARPATDGRVVDVTGWSQYYSRREGYTFENLVAAPGDPEARWVVVREAHLIGPWTYCKQLSALVAGIEPVRVFTSMNGKRPTRVLVYDRQPLLALRAVSTRGNVRR